jgi:hypothetical protein
MRSADARKTTRASSRKRAAQAGEESMVVPGRRPNRPRSMQEFDRELHGDPRAQVVNTRSIEARSVPPTGIAKERRGKK